MNTIKISIVTVCYNATNVIKNVLQSVLSQTYMNLEYIIVDGASKDNTVEVLKEYEQRFEGRMRWVSEPDNGVYDAMNKALDMATGDFVLFLGADDHLLSPDTISKVISMIDKNDVVYYGDVYRNSRNDLYRGKFNKYLLACENICHQAILYPRPVYKSMKYDLKFPIYADYVYNIRNWRKYNFKYLPICISFYNCSGLSGSEKSGEKFGKSMMDEIKKNLGYMCYLIRLVYKFVKRIE